jgi:hypothetical protein
VQFRVLDHLRKATLVGKPTGFPLNGRFQRGGLEVSSALRPRELPI